MPLSVDFCPNPALPIAPALPLLASFPTNDESTDLFQTQSGLAATVCWGGGSGRVLSENIIGVQNLKAKSELLQTCTRSALSMLYSDFKKFSQVLPDFPSYLEFQALPSYFSSAIHPSREKQSEAFKEMTTLSRTDADGPRWGSIFRNLGMATITKCPVGRTLC